MNEELSFLLFFLSGSYICCVSFSPFILSSFTFYFQHQDKGNVLRLCRGYISRPCTNTMKRRVQIDPESPTGAAASPIFTEELEYASETDRANITPTFRTKWTFSRLLLLLFLLFSHFLFLSVDSIYLRYLSQFYSVISFHLHERQRSSHWKLLDYKAHGEIKEETLESIDFDTSPLDWNEQ